MRATVRGRTAEDGASAQLAKGGLEGRAVVGSAEAFPAEEGGQGGEPAHAAQEGGIDGAGAAAIALQDLPGEGGPVGVAEDGDIEGGVGDGQAGPAEDGGKILPIGIGEEVVGRQSAVHQGGREGGALLVEEDVPPAAEPTRVVAAELGPQGTQAAGAEVGELRAPGPQARDAEGLGPLDGVGVQFGEEAGDGAGEALLVALGQGLGLEGAAGEAAGDAEAVVKAGGEAEGGQGQSG